MSPVVTVRERVVMQDSTQNQNSSSNGGLVTLTADAVMLLIGLTAAAFAFVGLIFWFSAYANASPDGAVALSPFLLALLGAFIAGATLIGAVRDGGGGRDLLSWSSRLGLVAAGGFVAVGGIVPEFREAQEGTDWAIFKWVALVAFYGGSSALLLSVVLLIWRLSRVRIALRSGLGSLGMPSFSVPRVTRPRLVVQRGDAEPPIVGE